MGWTANLWASPGYTGTVGGGGGGSDIDTVPVDITGFSNGWTTPGTNKAQYQKKIDGLVYLTGRITPGTMTVGTLIATLPVGRRPDAQLFGVYVYFKDSPFSVLQVEINTDGTIKVYGFGGTPAPYGDFNDPAIGQVVFTPA